jgi:opacity protein-like surface antigen
MSILKMSLLSVAVLGSVSLTAHAADYTPDVPSEVDTASGFYVRGDAGWSFLQWSGGKDDSDFVIGGGVGYQLNDMLRTDLTVDTTGKYTVAPGSDISTTTVMGNVYLDWANDTPFTPYVGLGAGYGWVSNHPDGIALGASAGVSVNMTNNLDFDVGYRFRDISTKGPDVMEHMATVGMRFKF